MDMPLEIRAFLLGLGIVSIIGTLVLIFGDRPELAAHIRSWFAEREREPTVRRVSTVSPAPAPPVAPAPAPSAADGRTDGRTDVGGMPRTADARTCASLQLDRTREGLIAVLVYNGWQVEDIRRVVKGENAAIGAAVAAAREQQHTPPAPSVTPIAERQTSARFMEDLLEEAEPPAR